MADEKSDGGNAFAGLTKKPDVADQGQGDSNNNAGADAGKAGEEENRVTFASTAQTDQNKPANEAEKDAAQNQAEVLSEEGARRNEVTDRLAASASAVEAEDQASDDDGPAERIWSSHPIQNYRYGGFQFEKGTLRLTDPKDIERFESKLAGASDRVKNQIREINRAGADKIGRAFQSSRRVRGIDTSRPGPGGG